MAEQWTHRSGRRLPPRLPRPGGIALRPLKLGDLFGGSFAALARYGVPLAAAMFLGQLGALLLLAAAAAGALALHVRPVDVLVPGAAFATLLIGALASALTAAVLRRAVPGRPAGARTLLRAALPRWAAVLGTQLLVLAAVAGPGAALLAAGLPPLSAAACLPVSLGLGVLFALAPTAAAYEGIGPLAALRRSARLVRGAWWRTLGVTTLATAIAAGAAFGMLRLIPAVDGFLAHAVLAALGVMAAQTLLFCFPQLTVGLLYVDRRIRRDDLAADPTGRSEELSSA